MQNNIDSPDGQNNNDYESWLDRPKYTNVKTLEDRTETRIPQGTWVKCENCLSQLSIEQLEKNSYVCLKCDEHLTISTDKWISLLSDKNSFKELFSQIKTSDPLEFKTAGNSYKDKISLLQKKLQVDEAVKVGRATLNDIPILLSVMEFSFIGGSMGSVVGERIFLAMKMAADKKIPFISVARSGGARMHEGILSLMQMAKTSAGTSMLSKAGSPFISIITQPTMGGVTASFASLGDIIIAEPRTQIGFAGPRVIQEAVKQKLPKNFQSAESLLENGFLDMIVSRNNLKQTLSQIINILKN